jgi:predicted acetyltransferase
MNFIVRKAKAEEYDQIYLMGYDTWSDGMSVEDYLSVCRSSSKYQSGEWYVLVNENEILSSLITYNLAENQFGIGSIACPPFYRRKGFASRLIIAVLKELDFKYEYPTYFLYADINPEFYTKFGFTVIEPALQKNAPSICMVKPGKVLLELNEQIIPKYF